MSTGDFLFELGTEELPPTALKTLSIALGDSIESQLKAAQLSYEAIELYAAPRRLGFLVKSLSGQQPDRSIERTGPSAKAPEKAAMGFAGSCGVSLAELSIESTEKGDY